MRDECIAATADAEKFTIELNYRAAAAPVLRSAALSSVAAVLTSSLTAVRVRLSRDASAIFVPITTLLYMRGIGLGKRDASRI